MGNKIIRISATGAPGLIQNIIAGDNITVDNTDPANPVVASTGGGDPGAYKEDWTPVLGVGPLIFTQSISGAVISGGGFVLSGTVGGGAAGYSGAVIFQDATKRGVRFSLDKTQFADGQVLYIGFLNGIVGQGGSAGLLVGLQYDQNTDNILLGAIGNIFANDVDAPINTHTYISGDQIMVSIDNTGLTQMRIGGIVYGYTTIIPLTTGLIYFGAYYATPGNVVDVSLSQAATIYPTITDYNAPATIATNYPADRAKQGYKITGVGSIVLTIGTVTDGDIVYFDETIPDPVLIGRTVADDGTDDFLTQPAAVLLFAQKVKNDFNFSGEPGPSDDIFAGFSSGSTILQTDIAPNEFWVCSDNAAAAAVWLKTTLTIDELAQLLTDIQAAQDTASTAQTDATQALADAATAQNTADGVGDALAITNQKIFVGAANGNTTLTNEMRKVVWYNSAGGAVTLNIYALAAAGYEVIITIGKFASGDIYFNTNGLGNWFKPNIVGGGVIDTGGANIVFLNGINQQYGKTFRILKLHGVIPGDEIMLISDLTGAQI